MFRRTSIAAAVAALLLVAGCGDASDADDTGKADSQPLLTSTADPETGDESSEGDGRYDEILGAVAALDESDVDTTAIYDAASANLALDWSEASSPYMFAEYAWDEVSETGTWCIQSKQGVSMTLLPGDADPTGLIDDTGFLVDDGACNYDLSTAKIVADTATSEGFDDPFPDSALLIRRGVELLTDGLYTTTTAVSPLLGVVSGVGYAVALPCEGTSDRDCLPDTLPDLDRDTLTDDGGNAYEVSGYTSTGKQAEFCVVDPESGVWVLAVTKDNGTDSVAYGAEGATCARS